MTGSNRTASGLKAVLLVAVLFGSVIGMTGLGAAAASDVAGNATTTFSEGGGSGTVSVDITADSAGITNETLEMRIIDPSDGSVVYNASQAISVSANNTSTFQFDVSASDVPDDGTYDVEYEVVESNISTTHSGAVTVTATDSVNIESDTDYMYSDENQTTLNVTLEAGDSGFDSEPVTVTVINAADGETSFSRDVQNVTLAAGEEASLQVTLNRSEFGMTGAHTVRVAAGDATDSATINLESVTIGGGTGGDDGGNLPVDPLVILLALISIALAAAAFATQD